MVKQNQRKRTMRNRNKPPELGVIRNAELDRHRKMFLGKPGSKKWLDYHKSMIETKRRLFGEDGTHRANNRKMVSSNGTRRREKGGGDGVLGVKTKGGVESKDNDSDSSDSYFDSDIESVSSSGSDSDDDSETKITEDQAATNANINNKTETTPPITANANNNEQLINNVSKNNSNTQNNNVNGQKGDTINGQIDASQETVANNTVEEANKQLKKKFLKGHDDAPFNDDIAAINNKCVTILDGALEPKDVNEFVNARKQLESSIKTYNKNPGTPEHVEQSIQRYNEIISKIDQANVNLKANDARAKSEFSKSFGVQWLSDVFDDPDMKLLLQFAKNVNTSDSPLTIPKSWEGNLEYKSVVSAINNNMPTAEDVKIEYIPFFLQVYLRLISAMNYAKDEKKKVIDAALRKPAGSDDLTAPKTLRRLILFSIRIMRDMNMYVNPLFFDDLYYYYYFLQLDRWFDIDSLFRGINPGKDLAQDEKGARLTMKVFEQAASDSDRKEIKYGVQFREQLFNENPARDFDFWLNMIRVRPDWDSSPFKSEISADLTMTPVKNNVTLPTLKVDTISDNANGQKGGEGEGEAMPEGEAIPEGEGEAMPEGEGEAMPEGEGEAMPEGEGEAMPEGEAIPEGEGELEQPSNESDYKFLDDRPLAQRLEDVMQDSTAAEYKVYMCIYSLDRSCTEATPFLKFLTQKPDETNAFWSFPSFDYSILDKEEHNEQNFQCEFFTKLLDTLNISLCGSESTAAVGGNGADAVPERDSSVEQADPSIDQEQATTEDPQSITQQSIPMEENQMDQ